MAQDALRAVATGKPPADAKPVERLSFYLTKHSGQIKAALQGTLIQPEKMSRLALTAFSSSTALQECSIISVFKSVVLAAQMGLEIGVAGHGFLVPYRGEAQFVPGWMGLVDLVNRSGRASVWTGAVFDGDYFEWQLGDSPGIKHKPAGDDDPAKLMYVYAVGRVKGSDWPVIEVWPIARVLRHRDKYNKVGKKHYSYENVEMYARKIPLLQVLKYMPKSVEVQRAITAIHAAEAGERPVFDADFTTVPDDDPPPAGSNQGGGTDASAQGKQGTESAGQQGTTATQPTPGSTDRASSAPADTAKEIAEKKNPSPTAAERVSKAAEKAAAQLKMRNVVDMDGQILFQTNDTTDVGATGVFNGKKYTVKSVADAVIQVEFAVAPERTLSETVTQLLEQARDVTDLQVAEAKFEEARGYWDELLPANQERLRALRTEVDHSLAQRRMDAL